MGERNEKPTKRGKVLKTIAGIFMGLILISLTLMAVVGCDSSGSGDSDYSDSGSVDSGSDDSESIAFGYDVVDTGQTACYDDNGYEISCPESGDAFYGQDAQFDGIKASFTDNGDGTVTENVTGLM